MTKPSFTKDDVLNVYAENPEWTVRQIADHLGAKREYVYATLRRAGAKMNRVNWWDNPARLREYAAQLITRAEELERGTTVSLSVDGDGSFRTGGGGGTVTNKEGDEDVEVVVKV